VTSGVGGEGGWEGRKARRASVSPAGEATRKGAGVDGDGDGDGGRGRPASERRNGRDGRAEEPVV
jgi:hypothetical protein